MLMNNISRNLDSVNNTSLQDQAYQFIKSQILQRKIGPGKYYSDTDFASQLNMSRTPVKAALNLLEHEGLVQNDRRKGWKVLSITLEDIRQIFEIKIDIEAMLIKKAAQRLKHQNTQELLDILERMKTAAFKKDFSAWIRADVEFHHLLYTLGDNPRAYRIVQNLNEQWNRVWVGILAMEGRIQQSLLEHQGIAEAVLAGNGDLAEARIRDHLHLLQIEVEQVLNEVVFPVTANSV